MQNSAHYMNHHWMRSSSAGKDLEVLVGKKSKFERTLAHPASKVFWIAGAGEQLEVGEKIYSSLISSH